MNQRRWKRTNLEVTAIFDPFGKIMPEKIKWNGHEYNIESIIEVKNSTAYKVGGSGLRYTCYIKHRLRNLFYDGKQWFVEERISI